MNFVFTKHAVEDQGHPPDSFLTELVNWAKDAPEEIFAPNTNLHDVYAFAFPVLGPWSGQLHRRAAMCEVMRVHAGFESSWKWGEGVDKTNATSMRNIEGQETGIFQVSFDSVFLGDGAMKPFAKAHGIDTPLTFIPAMKADPGSGPTEAEPERPITHWLALEYYARLVRVSLRWAGPLIRNGNGASDDVSKYIRRDACAEFQSLLA